MSLKKSATRRLSLLTGSSLVLSALAFTGGAFAPTGAMAASECGNPSTNGAAADVLICTPGSYPTGIDYGAASDGHLTLILRDRVNTGTSNTAGSGPILMYGDVGENMSLLREDTVSVIGDPRIVNTTGAGRAIDVSTQGAGAIVINLTDGDPTAGEPNTPAATAPAPMRVVGSTDAIRARAAGAGSVSVVIAATGTPSGTDHLRALITAGASGGSGIVATTTTGAINIDTGGATINANGAGGFAGIDASSTSGNINIVTFTITGRQRGIYARTGGGGAVTVTTAGSQSFGGEGPGLEATAGTGGLNIAITGGAVRSDGSYAILGASAGSASISNAGMIGGLNSGGVTPVGGRVDFSGVAGGGVTFTNTGATDATGRWIATGASVFSGGNDLISMTGVGQNWLAPGASIDMGAGSDTFTMNAALNAQAGSSIAFGSGSDTFNLGGVLVMDGVTLTGLEAFNSSGLILMGAGLTALDGQITDFVTTDGAANDVLRMPGTTFTGGEDSRIVMDVEFGAGGQVGCETVTGVADCLYLPGGATAGVTTLTLNSIGASASQGGYDTVGITLVDVAGGTSAQGHFVLDPDTANLAEDGLYGQVIDRPGLFVDTLRYDATTQRHNLVSLPRSEVMNYAMLSGAAQSIWHMTSETVTDRQTDLRQGMEGSLWLRAAGEYSQRDTSSNFAGPSETFTIDNSYKLYAGTVIGGMDLITGASGGYDYVLGAQIGYVSSSFDLDESASSGRMTGAAGGVYASLWSDRFFLDGALNVNGLTLDHESPGLGAKTNTYLSSLGGQAEGGLRIVLGERAFVEPLATVAYVRTSFEELSLSGGKVIPADAESLRAALGARLGATLSGGGVNASWFVTGRAWNEFEGASSGIVVNPGADLPFSDELSGGFGEAEAGINLFNDSGTLSGFLTTGVKAKSGYSAVNLALGVRMAW